MKVGSRAAVLSLWVATPWWVEQPFRRDGKSESLIVRH